MSQNDFNRDFLIKFFASKSAYEPLTSLEIGTWTGFFSQRMLNEVNIKKLHLVDPWIFSPKLMETSIPNRTYGLDFQLNHIASQGDLDKIYEAVLEKFKNNDRVYIHRMTSAEASFIFHDNYFDWIYIDGDHSYESVLQDLQLYYLKVKTNGYITGDDFDWNKSGHYPIRDAVYEFLKYNNKIELLATRNNQFVMQKNG